MWPSIRDSLRDLLCDSLRDLLCDSLQDPLCDSLCDPLRDPWHNFKSLLLHTILFELCLFCSVFEQRHDALGIHGLFDTSLGSQVHDRRIIP